MTAIDTYTNTPDLFNIQKLNDREEEQEIKYRNPKQYILKDFNDKKNAFIVKSESTATLY
ncbi:hypothetical protein H8356DRAFT_1692174, partial [Neocallimastix lanati (nom. inval.)]